MNREPICSDCNFQDVETLSRRRFVQAVGSVAVGATLLPKMSVAAEQEKAKPESLVKKLYDSLNEKQREEICFAWDHKDDRGLLRTHVSNNWNITDKKMFNVGGEFFTKDQRDLIEALFFGLYNPEWHARLRKQLQDDAGGYGKEQTIAIFGEPGTGKFEWVMTGRHLTIRCDGDSTEHTAFGGPIFYGHAAQGFNEAADHPGNIYWHQALKANALYKMFDGKQRKLALVEKAPAEAAVGFRGTEPKSGIPVSELSADQKTHLQGILSSLLEPYRTADQQEATKCLEKFGGLDKCSLALYQSDDVGNDGVWDVWRLEGPAFVWHFRGSPHVHVWVNIADDPNVQLNARG